MTEEYLPENEIKKALKFAQEEERSELLDIDEVMELIYDIPDYQIEIKHTRKLAGFLLRATQLIFFVFIVSLIAFLSFADSRFDETQLLIFNLLSVFVMLITVFIFLEFNKKEHRAYL